MWEVFQCRVLPVPLSCIEVEVAAVADGAFRDDSCHLFLGVARQVLKRLDPFDSAWAHTHASLIGPKRRQSRFLVCREALHKHKWSVKLDVRNEPARLLDLPKTL